MPSPEFGPVHNFPSPEKPGKGIDLSDAVRAINGGPNTPQSRTEQMRSGGEFNGTKLGFLSETELDRIMAGPRSQVESNVSSQPASREVSNNSRRILVENSDGTPVTDEQWDVASAQYDIDNPNKVSLSGQNKAYVKARDAAEKEAGVAVESLITSGLADKLRQEGLTNEQILAAWGSGESSLSNIRSAEGQGSFIHASSGEEMTPDQVASRISEINSNSEEVANQLGQEAEDYLETREMGIKEEAAEGVEAIEDYLKQSSETSEVTSDSQEIKEIAKQNEEIGENITRVAEEAVTSGDVTHATTETEIGTLHVAETSLSSGDNLKLVVDSAGDTREVAINIQGEDGGEDHQIAVFNPAESPSVYIDGKPATREELAAVEEVVDNLLDKVEEATEAAQQQNEAEEPEEDAPEAEKSKTPEVPKGYAGKFLEAYMADPGAKKIILAKLRSEGIEDPAQFFGAVQESVIPYDFAKSLQQMGQVARPNSAIWQENNDPRSELGRAHQESVGRLNHIIDQLIDLTKK